MKSFFDEELGNVLIKKHGRAKRVLARRLENHIQLTVPSKMPKDEVLNVFEKLKPRILTLPPLEPIKVNEHSKINSFTFTTTITRNPISETQVSMKLHKGILTINVPPHFDINDEKIQVIIKDMLIHALRHEAKRVLPIKVASFAKKWNLTVREVKINRSKTRWGSCTGRKNINLSLFLMMLPERLIDYVILHELAHTIELNHGKRFWQILNVMCEGKADALNQESTNWETEHISFLKR